MLRVGVCPGVCGQSRCLPYSRPQQPFPPFPRTNTIISLLCLLFGTIQERFDGGHLVRVVPVVLDGFVVSLGRLANILVGAEAFRPFPALG